ncbi:hypothetical protein Y032_0198g1598 [Ancylostoma ceylanicum]|nr:hypothetical protein Y032_0198g1598 [Ancylostoma ceylanicum]
MEKQQAEDDRRIVKETGATAKSNVVMMMGRKDVGSQEYDVRTSQWRANDRKAKRTTLVNGGALTLNSYPSTGTQDMESGFANVKRMIRKCKSRYIYSRRQWR